MFDTTEYQILSPLGNSPFDCFPKVFLRFSPFRPGPPKWSRFRSPVKPNISVFPKDFDMFCYFSRFGEHQDLGKSSFSIGFIRFQGCADQILASPEDVRPARVKILSMEDRWGIQSGRGREGGFWWWGTFPSRKATTILTFLRGPPEMTNEAQAKYQGFPL